MLMLFSSGVIKAIFLKFLSSFAFDSFNSSWCYCISNVLVFFCIRKLEKAVYLSTG